MAKVNYTADLQVVSFDNYPPHGQIARGYVYEDKKGRFKDGAYIHTSLIVKETKRYIYTLNSIYRKIP